MRKREFIGDEAARKEAEEVTARVITLSKRLTMPIPVVVLKMKVSKIPDDEVKARREGLVRGLVRNMYNRTLYWPIQTFARYGSTYADDSLAMKETDGTIQDNLTYGVVLGNLEGGRGYGAGASDTDFGILVGTGTNAEDFDDFALQTLIADGNGAGEMEYAAMTVTEGWNAGGPYYWSQWERNIDNLTASTITVQEVGFVFQQWPAGTTEYNFLRIRDRIAGGQAVLTTERLTVQYQTRVAFP